MASGGPRPFLTKLLLPLAMLLVPASASAVGDGQIGPNAAIQAFKLKFGYTNEAAYIAARTAAYQSAGVRLANVADGEFFYRQSDNTFRCYDGTVPYNVANWAACAAGGSGTCTLDAAYQTGRTINRTAATGSIVVQDGTNDTQPSLDMNRTVGTAAVIDISNGGTGNDITSNDWNVTTAGVATFAGVKVASDKDVSFGTAANAKVQWDTAGTAGLFVDMAQDTPLYLCTDGAGCDFYLYSGTVGDLIKFDSSAKSLIFTDTTLNLGESDAVKFGATGAWTIAGTDAGPLKIASTAPGSDIWVGVDGAGANLYLFGDTASAQVLWSQIEDALTVKGGASVWLQDSVELAFGTAASKVGDLSMSYSGATDILSIERPGEGAVGDIAVEKGVALYLGPTDVVTPADGFKITNGASIMDIDGVISGGAVRFGATHPVDLEIDGASGTIIADVSDNEVTFDGETLQLNDNDELYFGDGAAAAGDVKLYWDATSLNFAPVAAEDVTVDFGPFAGSADNVDVRFNAATGGDGWFWDADAETMTMTGAQFVIGKGNHSENVITWGDTKKINMYHDGTDMYIVSDWFETTSLVVGDGMWGTNFTWNPGGGVEWKLVNNGGMTNTYLQTNVTHNTGAGINFTYDVTTSPVVSGVKLEQNGGTDLQIDSNAVAGGAIVFGANNNPLDVSFSSMNGGAFGQTMLWDWSENAMSFTDSDAKSWYTANAKTTFGGTVGSPKYTLYADAGNILNVATGGAANGTLGAANGTLQIGMNAANTRITTNFGDVTTAGIQVVPTAAAGTQIQYMVQKPVERVFIPAGSFVPAVGVPTVTTSNGAYGWEFTDATDKGAATFWQPPLWVDTAVNIEATALYSCASGGASIVLNLNYGKITPGTSLTNLSNVADVDDPQTIAVATANKFESNTAAGDLFTINAGTFSNAGFTPTQLVLTRTPGAGGDNTTGSCWFYGLNLNVTRKYVD
jgi:hypothetical protein